MGKYSDIRRAKELTDALTKLRAWEDKTLTEKRTLYKSQRGSSKRVEAKRVGGYVEAFGLVGRVFLPVRLLAAIGQESETALVGIVEKAVKVKNRAYNLGEALPAGSVLLDGFKGFKAAKLSLTKRGSVVTDNKSRITTLEYKRYDNKSVSSPFGSETAGSESYADAVKDIRKIDAIENFLKTEGNRIAFTPEML